jgi:hypothetical protein
MTAADPGKISPLEYLVSDGKTIKAKFTGTPEKGRGTVEHPAPKNTGDSLRKMVARAGLGDPELAFLLKLMRPDFDVNKEFQVSGFKLGAEGKVGRRTAKVITYKLTAKNQEVAAVNCTVWLDAETLVPLKHLLEVDRDRGITATYTTFDLKAKVDAKSGCKPVAARSGFSEPRALASGESLPLPDGRGSEKPTTPAQLRVCTRKVL